LGAVHPQRWQHTTQGGSRIAPLRDLRVLRGERCLDRWAVPCGTEAV